ncbi:acyl carrier protein [Streptomyces sp. TRM76323]|uniref:Acyl carrier protein n=1 Tax=Streptomyces tamarix TaxID=3078565 RepID=A0ABU3QD49_9ACTN|nr:acyl carrier protein [Streptomyces tamarix]MDT9680672.1 acyl carrier protein [Streptomyces tamarix]
MAQITVDDVRRILVACAGDMEGVGPDTDITHLTFEDLGYDSLALMESAAQIKQEFGVVVPDDEITKVTTPQELANLVNGLVARAA